MKVEVKGILEEKYNEEFIVFHDSYNHIQQTYQFQAAPAKEENLVFVGWHNKDFTDFKDQYIQKYLSSQFCLFVKKEVEKFIKPSYIFTRITFNDEVYDHQNVSVDTLKIEHVLDTASYISFDISCCLFKDLNENTKTELLSGLYNVLEPFKQHPDAHISLLLYLWKPEIIAEKSIGIFDPDPRNHGGPIIDKIEEKENYILKRLNLYLRTDKVFDDFNLDTMFFNTHSVKEGSWKVDPLRLNKNTMN
jgi:hypothetical protein